MADTFIGKEFLHIGLMIKNYFMADKFDKPKVFIDIDEYLELKNIEHRYNEGKEELKYRAEKTIEGVINELKQQKSPTCIELFFHVFKRHLKDNGFNNKLIHGEPFLFVNSVEYGKITGPADAQPGDTSSD